jgi:hypothetical protein
MTRTMQRSKVRRWLATLVALAVIVATLLIPASSLAADEPTDMVHEWNVNALAAIGNANGATPPGLNQPPPLAPLHLAMVQIAVYDAVNAIDRTHEPYLGGLKAPASASKAAAVATAAHDVLVGLVPATLPQVKASLDTLYATSLGKIPADTAKEATAKTDGISIGARAATAMLANRSRDGRFGARTFVVGTEAGEWRPVAPLSNNVFAWIMDVRPFSLNRSNQFRTAGPPDLDSEQYATEFDEVKALGGTASSRTPDQALLAAFVSNNPVGPINRAFRELSAGLSTAEQARLFAMTSMSAADALIACWNNKVHWNFWRPQTAIQNAAADGNDATAEDTTWTSLVATPGYPDNPSGYNCFAAASMYSARAFFGTDDVSFELKNPGSTPPTQRSYDRFTDFVDDAIDGRILIGLHFRSADEQAALLGQKVAWWVDKNHFGPVD